MTLYGVQWICYTHVKRDGSTFKKRFERFEGDEYGYAYSANPQGEIVTGPNVQQHLGLFKTKEAALAAAEYDHTHWVDEYECPHSFTPDPENVLKGTYAIGFRHIDTNSNEETLVYMRVYPMEFHED